ncbi:hypothetical protein DDZ14_08380 [Maritimibacter sp. 55A14]|uniref:hypothetical protein n=1 Tax=Maritimibacter sp. 55A14 TaxID=2174844 RepID=UPI000D61040D|nr:hypothetical protein [Maritimibacter sp. 55A14]PWE32753.1 hypothetical protein DDZ14_08380 [Maritimibacter sp. 55A14]
MTGHMKTLLAAASNAAGAAEDMIECAREGKITPHDSVGSGDTATILADSLRLLIEATDSNTGTAGQLHGALIRYLEERSL